jgi:hypothetical protein
MLDRCNSRRYDGSGRLWPGRSGAQAVPPQRDDVTQAAAPARSAPGSTGRTVAVGLGPQLGQPLLDQESGDVRGSHLNLQ